MRAQDLIRPGLKTFRVRIRLRQRGYTQHMDTTVQARTAEQARRIIRAQYNDTNVMVGQPKLITLA